MTAIIVGVRWQTLPEDIANVQELLKIVANFGVSVVKQLCKKRLSNFTDNSLVYPRPPRTESFQVPQKEESQQGESEDDEKESVESESEKDAPDSEDSDSDVHGDFEKAEKED